MDYKKHKGIQSNLSLSLLLAHTEELCKAPVKIKAAAAMTHGYRNSDVKDKCSFNETKSAKELMEYSEEKNTYYVAHNAPFDLGMLGKEGISFDSNRVIDTLRVARHMYQNDERIEMFKLQYFRYIFENEDGTDEFENLEKEYMKKLNIDFIQPHTALSDILVLWIFHNKLEKDFGLTPEKMVELSQKPVLELNIQFGNVFEKGKPYSEIIKEKYVQYGRNKNGYEYLMWAVENMSMSIDREYSLKYYLAKGILDKDITSVIEHQKYLNWGLIFVFDEEESKKALDLLKCVNKLFNHDEHINILKSAYERQTLERIAKVEALGDDASKEDIESMNKDKFNLNYFLKYRK